MFELRRYELFPGTRERMRTRFRDVNLPLFERHGITLEHAWEDVENEDVFWFLASFADRDARERAWAAYHEDPDFLAAKGGQAEIIKDIHLHLLESSPVAER